MKKCARNDVRQAAVVLLVAWCEVAAPSSK